MDKKRLLLAAKMLRMAAELFSNHGCNDLPADTYDGWEPDELEVLCADMQRFNDDIDGWPETPLQIGDDGLMDFLADELERAAKKEV